MKGNAFFVKQLWSSLVYKRSALVLETVEKSPW